MRYRTILFLIWLLSSVGARGQHSSSPKPSDQSHGAAKPQYEFTVIANTGESVDDRVVSPSASALIAMDERGDVLWYAQTDRDWTAFLNRKAMAYIGKQVSGKTITHFEQPVMNKHGDIAYGVRFNGGEGIVKNNELILQTGQDLGN